MCWTAAIPARSARSPQRSIRRAPCSSSPANPVRRWSRSCCGPISSIWSDAGRRRWRSGKTLRCGHRSGLRAGEDREDGRVRPCLCRRSGDRRTLFRAVVLRDGARGRDRHRRPRLPRRHSTDGHFLRRRRSAGRQSWRSARRDHRRGRQGRPQQADDPSERRITADRRLARTIARGIRPASKARA